MTDLEHLANLLREHHRITAQIAALIGRPAERGHIGEFIAERIFAITLASSATHKGSDGVFSTGSLGGKSVNVKFYGVNSGVLDIATAEPPDYYLVLTGSTAGAVSSRGATRPLTIEQVYLFDHHALIDALGTVTIGVATSVRKALWKAAELYPHARNPHLTLTDEQRALLALFRIA